MLCDEYKEALMETAAGGAGLAGSLREHVAMCARCRALLAEQEAVFAAVDFGLRCSANATVPDGFLPKARVRLAEEQMRGRSWSFAWAGLAASAALIILAVMVTRGRHVEAPLAMQQTSPASESLRHGGGEKLSGVSRDVLSTEVQGRRREFRSDAGVGDPQPLIHAGDQEAMNQFIDRAARGEIGGERLLTGEDLKRGEDLQIPRIEIATIAKNLPEEAGSPSNMPAVSAPEISIDPDRRTK